MPKGIKGIRVPKPTKSKLSTIDWTHESDAHTLAEATAIQTDPKRHANAKRAAGKLATEKLTMGKTMMKIANKAIKSTSGKK
jgi:hypothetical protein